MASSTSGAGHGTDPIQTTHISSNTAPVEMDNLDTSKKSIEGAGTSGLLNDIFIPETSFMTTDYQSHLPTSSALPTTSTSTTTAITTADMGDSSNQNAGVGDERSASQEQLTAQYTTNDEPSPTDPAPAPPPTMSKSEGKAPATESSSDAQESRPTRARLGSVAIGPSTESTHVMPASTAVDAGPALTITLLLGSGARHPYKIDEKYLTKRAVTVPDVTEDGKKDPLSISVYTLKELILREWREEWETKPSSPSSIRLIFFGKLLDDKEALKACKFNLETSNVVHMTIRPQDIVDEEDASKAKSTSRGREDNEINAGCRCVIL
ncbi:65deafbe-938c-4c14-b2a7-a3efa8143f87 [Sclerotinia trifoliorum]|uniref:65deafbe-938c-4c14-b2a7-a3efa8143f87 n=1 Tax=Sclerotinia trifoliorum TaxID=28548 RepID=A0A8H2VMF4_9HELO|nr:65deafbe-938c-4c14-b2a7-a3efa8143f87 [Sclerotinia trifoliorum]